MRFGGKRGLSTNFTCQDPVRKSELTRGISKDGIFKRNRSLSGRGSFHTWAECSQRKKLKAAETKMLRSLGQGHGQGRLALLSEQKVLSEQLWRGEAGSSLPSSGIHSLSLAPPIGSVNKRPTPQESGLLGDGFEAEIQEGDNPLVHEASGSLEISSR